MKKYHRTLRISTPLRIVSWLFICHSTSVTAAAFSSASTNNNNEVQPSLLVPSSPPSDSTTTRNTLYDVSCRVFTEFLQSKDFLSCWQRRPMLAHVNDFSTEILTVQQIKLAAETNMDGLGKFVVGTVPSIKSLSSSGTWNDGAAAKVDTKSAAGIQRALEDGTLVWNGCGCDCPSMADICRAATITFELPVQANAYITLPEQAVSLPPHTDAQHVMVIQTEGHKHWKVYGRLNSSRNQRGRLISPLARGKNGDVVTEKELQEPILDVWLSPGDVLYIPLGFCHATSTDGGDTTRQIIPSTHITLGLDTHYYSLTFGALRRAWFTRYNRLSLQARGPLGYLELMKNNKLMKDYDSRLQIIPYTMTDRQLQLLVDRALPLGTLALKSWIHQNTIKNKDDTKSSTSAYREFAKMGIKELQHELSLDVDFNNKPTKTLDDNNGALTAVLDFFETYNTKLLQAVRNKHTNVDPTSRSHGQNVERSYKEEFNIRMELGKLLKDGSI